MQVRIGRQIFTSDVTRHPNGHVVGGTTHDSINAAKRAMRKVFPSRAFNNWRELGPKQQDALWDLVGSKERDQRVPAAPLPVLPDLIGTMVNT